MTDSIDVKTCPICNQPNKCGQAVGFSHDLCWCAAESFPQQIFELIPPELVNKACICKNCLDKFKQFERMNTKP